ncbi:MAG: class I SAM-dependent methyltransferase [Proteobacteria bacterium]|nr:class I SAM-dependent methyltransferase [Pseudomonadota bacterium]
MLGRAADALNRLGLGDAAFRGFQRLQAWGASSRVTGLPPAYLRVLTAGSPDPGAFVHVGQVAARTFMALAETHGVRLSAEDEILDFGCGCGRVAGPLAGMTPAALHGCDLHPRLIGWCRANLAGDFVVSRPTPPLPYAPGRFALVYSVSVFTHMHEPQAAGWLAELARVTRPGGLALLTFLDERLPGGAALEPRLSAEGFVVRREGAEGSNLLCGYFTADGLARRAAPHWTLLEHRPSDLSGIGQAVAVLRRS